MTIDELHKKLQVMNISQDRYYLHGLYGSSDDNNKLALVIKKGRYTIEFEVYYRELGQKQSIKSFTDENKACKYFLSQIQEDLNTRI